MLKLALALSCTCIAILSAAIGQTSQPVTIRVGRLIDGRGGSQQNVVITLNGSKIASIGQATGPVTYDLSKYTLLPGFIDVHVHILWHFGPDGRFAQRDTAEERIAAGVDNAKTTVMNGFTSVPQINERSGMGRGNRGAGGAGGAAGGAPAGAPAGPPPLATPDQLRQA